MPRPFGMEERKEPFARPFSQAPAVAPARKVRTKLSNVNVSIIAVKHSSGESVPRKKTKPSERLIARKRNLRVTAALPLVSLPNPREAVARVVGTPVPAARAALLRD